MSAIALADVIRERERLGIQMHANELFFIARAVNASANFLVFGLGNDAPFWQRLNRQGRTVFIEDQAAWFDRLTREHPALEAYRVDYGTIREQAVLLIDHPESLAMELPACIRDIAWDVILVDGPAGNEDGTPGRMKSIYEASRLVRRGGSVFLHDQEREIERTYGERYLGRQNIVAELRGRALLRQYVTSNQG